MQTFWKKTCRELYRQTTLTVVQTQEITDEELEDTMWETSRPWEEQWESLKVNESKEEEEEIDDMTIDKHGFGDTDRTGLQSMKRST